MSNTEDRAYEAAGMHFERMLRVLGDEAIARLEPQITSPIERAMFIGFVAAALMIGDRACLPGQRYNPERDWFRVWHQHQIDRYRVDFAIDVFSEAKDGSIAGRIVVECDGHAFHERTKEQARNDRSRDRELTKLGYKVLRFTGSEIYENASACVDDVLAIVLEIRGVA